MYLNSYIFKQSVAKFLKLYGFREVRHRDRTYSHRNVAIVQRRWRSDVAWRVAVTSSPPTNRPTGRARNVDEHLCALNGSVRPSVGWQAT